MFNLQTILPTIGYVGIFAIIFSESGLLIGFFLPGDSLLFTAGFLAARGIFSIELLAVICFIAAVTGDSVGYAFGRKVGRHLFQRKESVLFKKENLEKAEQFYEKYGKKTIVIARFIPVIRTFAPIVAGIGKMQYSTFLAFNIIGGLLWAVGICLAGFYLGHLIPDIDKFLLPIIAFIIILSVAPSAWHILKKEENRKEIMKAIRTGIRKIFKSE